MTKEIDLLVMHSLGVLADAQRDPAKYSSDPIRQRALAYAQDIARQVADDALRNWKHLS